MCDRCHSGLCSARVGKQLGGAVARDEFKTQPFRLVRDPEHHDGVRRFARDQRR